MVSRRLIRKNKTIDWFSEIYLQLLAERGVMPIIVPIAEATKGILDEYLKDYDGMLMMEGCSGVNSLSQAVIPPPPFQRIVP